MDENSRLYDEIISRKWKYTLKIGKELREAIEDDDSAKTIMMLKKAFEEIHAQFPDVYDKDCLQNDLERIENIDEDDNEEINYALSDLYDYCDNTRIWIDI